MALLKRERLLLTILAGGFLSRLVLSSWNSYWLDELYSVAIYGVWNDTVSAALERLAATSVHPPLYQFVLFFWMDWFSDLEAYTRTLSNIYVTLGGFFLYLTLRDAISKQVALASVGGYSLLYTTMYYGLETRSYGQTIFLVSLSSYLLVRAFRESDRLGWKRALLPYTGAVLVLVNTAILLTHYYNVFFLAAQGLVGLVFVIWELPRRSLFKGLGVLAILYSIPVSLFGVAWGAQALATFRRMADAFSVEGSNELVGPIDLLFVSIIRKNIAGPRPLLWVGVALALVVLAGSALRVARRRGNRLKDWTILYLFAWLSLPLVMVFLGFLGLGVARYSPRYFVFSVVPLVPVLVVTACNLAGWVSSKMAYQRPLVRSVLSGILVVTLASAILPGTIEAATFRKADWRGTAERIAGMVESDPESRYLVIETSFRQTPVLNYHLARYSSNVRVDTTIRRNQEANGGPFAFEDPDVAGDADYVLIAFTHHRPENFPLALARLEEFFTRHLWQLDTDGRGLVMYRNSP